MYMAHVRFYVCCSDCVGYCGNVCRVTAVVKNSGFFSLGVLRYVVCLCRGYDGCCVFCLYCEAPSLGVISSTTVRCMERDSIVVLEMNCRMRPTAMMMMTICYWYFE